jgi:hypothetical protein
MASIQIGFLCAEIIAVGSIKGLNLYLDHRKKLKDEGHEDALLSSQIKKVGGDIMEGIKSRFSSRDNTPMRSRDVIPEEDEEEPLLTDTYPDEKSVDENDEHSGRLSVAESVLNSIPKLRLSRSKPKNSAINFISNLMQKKETKKTNKVFEEFAIMIMRFIAHELITQDEQPNHVLQQHKHYTAKLLKSLELQQKGKK